MGDRGVGAVVIARIVETDPLPAAGKPVVRGKEHRIPGRALHYQPAPVGVVFGCEVGHVEQRPRQEAQLAACQDGQGWIVRAVDGHVAEDHFKGGPARLVNAAVRPDESGITGAVVRITSGADIARRNQVAGVQVQGPFTGLVELHLLERGRAGFRNRDTAHPLLHHAVLHQGGGTAVIAGVVETESVPAADAVVIRGEDDRIPGGALGEKASQVVRGLARVVAPDVQRRSGQEAQLAAGRQREQGVVATVDLRVGEHQVQRPVGNIKGVAVSYSTRVEDAAFRVVAENDVVQVDQVSASQVQRPFRRLGQFHVLHYRLIRVVHRYTLHRLLHRAVGDRGVGAVVIARIVEANAFPSTGETIVCGEEHRIPGRALHYQSAPVGVVLAG